MSQQQVALDTRIEEYYDWFAVALFLLVPLDLLTTMGAAAEYGIGAESNPLMRWLLRQGPVMISLVNVVAVVVAVIGFSGVLKGVRRAPDPYDHYLELAVEGWLGLLLAAGFFVFANNLSVIVWGNSLV